MNNCKEKLPDGKPCPNQVDEGQKYCPYHLANQDKEFKKVLKIAGIVLGTVGAVIVAIGKTTAKRN